MDTEEEDISAIYINLFDMVNAFTNLQMDLIFSIRNYYKKKNVSRNILLYQASEKSRVVKRKPAVRKYWVRPGKDRYRWENFASRKVVEEEWRENFRMSRKTFQILCAELHLYIFKNDTRFRNAVPVDKQIAATLYYLSDEGGMGKVANAFGIGKSTASVIIRRVTKATSVHLAPKYIQIPSTENEVQEMVGQFYERRGFPQYLGAVDGTHIAINRPSVTSSCNFVNRKDHFTLNCQAAADPWPGSVHDAQIFANSSLNEALRNGIIPKREKVIVPSEDLFVSLEIQRILFYHS